MSTAVGVPASSARRVRYALLAAVVGSATAGLIHAAAVRTHQGDTTLMWMFSLCAAAQIGCAVAVALRPTRQVLALTLVVNGGALLVWALSRTVGIELIGSLADVEDVGLQDLAAASFAALAVLGLLRIVIRPVARAAVTPRWTAALATFALLAALPALTADHAQDDDHADVETASHEHALGDDAGHDDGDAAHGHDDATATADGHGHDEAATAEHPHTAGTESGPASHGHDGTDTTAPHDGHPPTTDGSHGHPPTTDGPPHPHPDPDPGDPPHPHPDPPDPGDPPTGPIISLDDPRVTPAQRAIAQDLIDDVRNALTAFPTVAAVEAAGYISIGDGGTNGYEHYVKWGYLGDAYELDPGHIESIVVKKNGTAPKTVVSALYILSIGKTMADVPTLAGPLTTFHDHQNLCFIGTRLVGLAVGGVCAVGTLLPTPPMLHVWIVPHPCGPFAGIDGHGTCGGHPDH